MSGVFKFVKPVHIHTILEGKLHFHKQPDRTLALKHNEVEYKEATDLLGCCFSSQDSAFTNAEMWMGFADDRNTIVNGNIIGAGKGNGMCFWFSISCNMTYGSASGDLQLELKRARERLNIPMTNPGLDMEGVPVYKVDTPYGVVYSDAAANAPAQTISSSSSTSLHSVVKEKKHESENEVRLFTEARPCEVGRDMAFTNAVNGFLRLRATFFGADFDHSQRVAIRDTIKNKFGQQVLVFQMDDQMGFHLC
ncbi:MAG: hypothetical protein ABSG21_10750 [Spirochaetia bacterium]|jgi:hypothetical protein